MKRKSKRTTPRNRCPYYVGFENGSPVICGKHTTYLCEFCDPKTKQVGEFTLEQIKKEIEQIIKNTKEPSYHPWRLYQRKKNEQDDKLSSPRPRRKHK